MRALVFCAVLFSIIPGSALAQENAQDRAACLELLPLLTVSVGGKPPLVPIDLKAMIRKGPLAVVAHTSRPPALNCVYRYGDPNEDDDVPSTTMSGFDVSLNRIHVRNVVARELAQRGCRERIDHRTLAAQREEAIERGQTARAGISDS